MTDHYPQAERYLAVTHEVNNQPTPLQDYNSFSADQALQAAVQREGAAWAEQEIQAVGEWAGRASNIELGFLANANKPELRPHDHYGHRIDQVNAPRIMLMKR